MNQIPPYGTPPPEPVVRPGAYPQPGVYPGSPEPTSATELACPKCQGVMRNYERNGITIDQCGTCRGIFLDFGELERLIQLEGRLAQPQQAPPPQPPAQPPPNYYYGPSWGHRGGYRYRRGGLSRLFFSS